MGKIQAIPTEYDGTVYRSRTEARWAVFFTQNDIPFSYENEGFDLNGMRYLPDFLLTDAKIWFEVKPFDPTANELEKARRLAVGTRMQVFIAPGAPSESIKLVLVDSSGHVRNGFQFCYAHEQGVGYISDNFWAPSDFEFKLSNRITNALGYYGHGVGGQLNEAGRHNFNWNSPSPQKTEPYVDNSRRTEARVVYGNPSRRVTRR